MSELTFGAKMSRTERLDLGEWWKGDESELLHCPRCGERKLLPPSQATDVAHLRICVACGVLPQPEPDA
jgi:Zn ribbon nucleic-acid-binding protein